MNGSAGVNTRLTLAVNAHSPFTIHYSQFTISHCPYSLVTTSFFRIRSVSP